MFLTEAQIIVRLLVAALLSGLIGLEREFKHKSAGLRTNVLVGMGSTLVMMTSIMSSELLGGEPPRIAAGIVTGFGFLGAGLIIQDKDRVHGITTAGAIWMVSAIGVAVGIGFYSAAIIATTITLLVLVFSRDDKIPAFLRSIFKRTD